MKVKEVLFLQEVSLDIEAAFNFYDAQEKGLGDYLFEDNIVTVAAILDMRKNPASIYKSLVSRKKNY